MGAETPAFALPPFKFNARGVLFASRGRPVCVAIIVNETGTALDATVYLPKLLGLSRVERSQILTNKFEPAKQAGIPVNSIVVMKAWRQ